MTMPISQMADDMQYIIALASLGGRNPDAALIQDGN
jgi:hypothetical protein